MFSAWPGKRAKRAPFARTRKMAPARRASLEEDFDFKARLFTEERTTERGGSSQLRSTFFFQLFVQRKRSRCQKERSKNVEAVFVTESSRITIALRDAQKKRHSQTHTGQQPHSRAHIRSSLR